MEENQEQQRKKSMFREVVELLVIFIIMFLVFKFLLMSVKVNGTSMVPNYADGDRGIMLRTNPINKANYGSVVVIDYIDENDNPELIVKRVFAMPNDTIEIKNNIVYVNGKEVDDPNRAKDTQMDDYPLRQLEDDEIFVLGDNRNVSLDSRRIGPVKIKDIEAVNGILFWPLNSIGLMN